MQPSRPGRSRPPGGTRRIVDRFEGRLLHAFSSPLMVLVVVAAMLAVTGAFASYGLRAPLRTDYLAMITGARILGAGGQVQTCIYNHETGAATTLFWPFRQPCRSA